MAKNTESKIKPSYLLKQDGDKILQENGKRIILEDSTK